MKKIIIISGKQGEGKTTQCKKLANKMKEQGLIVGGFIAPGTWKDGQRYSIDLLDLQTQKAYPFATREAQEGWEQIHTFYFNPQCIKKGEKLLRAHSKTSDWVFIDEVGKFDIKGKVWGPILQELLQQDISLVLSVRDVFVENVVAHFGIQRKEIVDESSIFS
ncbi:MAG: DUF2478 domain-containing protein [Bacteroidales bacterium]|nr:DUF2478 domain-containing protein [Bacteroidales bacterium]